MSVARITCWFEQQWEERDVAGGRQEEEDSHVTFGVYCQQTAVKENTWIKMHSNKELA